jgi:hypothetical protein
VGGRWRRPAAVLVLLEAIVILGFAVAAVLQLAAGRAVVVRNEVMLVVVLTLVAGALLVLARGLARGHRTVLGASLAWHVVVLLAVGGGLWQAGLRLGSAAASAVAVLAGVLTLLATRPDDPSPHGADPT